MSQLKVRIDKNEVKFECDLCNKKGRYYCRSFAIDGCISKAFPCKKCAAKTAKSLKQEKNDYIVSE